MNPLSNRKLIKRRIVDLSTELPKRPLKGAGYQRVAFAHNNVFPKLERLCPSHCVQISVRQPINGYGKIGYPKNNFISPELNEIVQANVGDFVDLDKSLKTVEDMAF